VWLSFLSVAGQRSSERPPVSKLQRPTKWTITLGATDPQSHDGRATAGNMWASSETQRTDRGRSVCAIDLATQDRPLQAGQVRRSSQGTAFIN